LKLVEFNGDYVYDFEGKLTEEVIQLIKEHLGVEDIDTMSEDEHHELQCDIEHFQAEFEDVRSKSTPRAPYTEFGRMMMGVCLYIASKYEEPEELS
jgi:hypothetical protein